MHSPRPQRLALFTGGTLDPYSSKTAVGLVRYRPEQVVCVLDSRHAGADLPDLIGTGAGIPIVGTVDEALAFAPTGLLLGLVSPGGELPESWRHVINDFLDRGLHVVSGLHTFLADDPDMAARSRRSGATITDLRRPPHDLAVGQNRAAAVPNLRVHTVGTDCNLGKKITALELTAAARRKGWDAVFVATGQTGIAIDGHGIAVDAVVSDFIAGAAERLVMENARREVLFIEGQGAITHPGFSGVTLGLLHGCAPQALVLCHHATRRHMRACPVPTPMPSPAAVLPLYEALARVNFPSKVVALSVNTSELGEDDARRVLDGLQAELELPSTDPIRFGVDPIMDALELLYAEQFGMPDL